MNAEYSCLNCECEFTIEITETEMAGSLDDGRTEACPACGQRIGTGPVRCRQCGGTFELAFRHWHMRCNVASGECPACATRYQALCIC